MIKYDIEENLTIRKINSEIFVFDRATGMVHTFNGTGGLIWEKIMQKALFNEIVQSMVLEYTITDEHAKVDVYEFLLELQKKKLLQIRDV